MLIWSLPVISFYFKCSIFDVLKPIIPFFFLFFKKNFGYSRAHMSTLSKQSIYKRDNPSLDVWFDYSKGLMKVGYRDGWYSLKKNMLCLGLVFLLPKEVFIAISCSFCCLHLFATVEKAKLTDEKDYFIIQHCRQQL